MEEEPAAGSAAEGDTEVKAEAGAEAKPEPTAAAGGVDGTTQEADEVRLSPCKQPLIHLLYISQNSIYNLAHGHALAL